LQTDRSLPGHSRFADSYRGRRLCVSRTYIYGRVPAEVPAVARSLRHSHTHIQICIHGDKYVSSAVDRCSELRGGTIDFDGQTAHLLRGRRYLSKKPAARSNRAELNTKNQRAEYEKRYRHRSDRYGDGGWPDGD